MYREMDDVGWGRWLVEIEDHGRSHRRLEGERRGRRSRTVVGMARREVEGSGELSRKKKVESFGAGKEEGRSRRRRRVRGRKKGVEVEVAS